jgi:hypothetical protein
MSSMGLTDTFFEPQDCLSCGFWLLEMEMDGEDWTLSRDELDTALARGMDSAYEANALALKASVHFEPVQGSISSPVRSRVVACPMVCLQQGVAARPIQLLARVTGRLVPRERP